MIDTSFFEGHPWHEAREDCFQCLRRYFQVRHNIQVRNYARPNRWWEQGLDLYRTFAKLEGFEELSILPRDVRESDVFLFCWKSEVPNHAAVYVGDGMMLHHMPGRLSEVGPYSALWRRCTVGVLRHRSLVQEVKPPEVIDFRELDPRSIINARALLQR
jgi:cell wall-associated NlpC family hydrolase